MSQTGFLDALVFRRVDYRYRGRSFQFDLSQSLFSSAAVDSGTHLLLSMIAAELDLDSYDRVVDMGCGTGTLGIALAGSANLELLAADRDARAVAFTERNASLNGLERVRAQIALTVPAYDGSGRELVVANLPAKAGEPVLRMLLRDSARRATRSGGAGALVVVTPLGDLLAELLEELGATVTAERRTANHVAVLYRCSLAPEPAEPEPDDAEACDLPPSFIRTTASFQGPKQRYTVQTAWNLPEFDKLSFRTALAFDLLTEHKPGGRIALYGCGQGHLAVGLLQRAGSSAELLLSDRDALALCVSATNALSNGPHRPETMTVATPGELTERIRPGTLGWLVVNDDPIAGSQWNEELLALAALLSPNGRFLVVSRSTTISRLQRVAGKALRQIDERKMHGFRASLLSPKR